MHGQVPFNPDSAEKHTQRLIRRAMWLFVVCSLAICVVLYWYGSKFQNTYMLQVRLENARRIDTYMRSMFHEINTRAHTIENRGNLDFDDNHEVKSIINASDMAMRLRSFYSMPDAEGNP